VRFNELYTEHVTLVFRNLIILKCLVYGSAKQMHDRQETFHATLHH